MKSLALVAHDNKKPELLNWVRSNLKKISKYKLFATGTTGKLLKKELALKVTCLKSGPLGGDQQIGAKITEGKIDMLVFFWDPLTAQPHDPDVRALLRLSTVYNIPTACNEATATAVLC